MVWEATTNTASPYTLTAIARTFNDAFGTGGTDLFDIFMHHRTVAGEWMHATGHLSAATTLVIDTVIDGSNGTLEVAWTAGTIDVTNDVPADSQSAAVRINEAQSFTAAEKAQGRVNTYAAPFDALAFSGMQVNGGMEVSQERGTTAVTLATGTESYVIDQWTARFARAATLAIDAQQVSSPTPPAGLQFGLQLKATTGLTPLAAGDYATLSTPIEGYRVSRLALGGSSAQSISIGFWVYATIAGTMAVTLTNSANNRSYVTDVVIDSAATWEYKTLTVPGDTSGTWLTTNGIGLRAIFCFGCGSTFQGTAGSWQASQIFGSSSTTNFMASTNNVAVIAGVVVLPGIELPASDRAALILRPFDQELLLASRYWQKTYSYATAPGTATSAGSIRMYTATTTNYLLMQAFFVPTMQGIPTLTIYDDLGASGKVFKGTNGKTSATTSVNEKSANIGTLDATSASELGFQYVASSRL